MAGNVRSIWLQARRVSSDAPFVFNSDERDLKFDRVRVNTKGGGISLGHPIGMSGARVILSLAYELRGRDLSLGLATLCISGGQGLAVVLERA